MARKLPVQYSGAVDHALNRGHHLGVMLLCASVAGLLAMAAAGAERVQRWPEWQRSRVALDQHFVREEFRIYYTLKGDQALPALDRQDRDRDGVPDKIQSLALQLVTARRCYVEILGLRHPFASRRYQGRVKFIDVNVCDLGGTKNGMAGDAIVNYHRPSDPPEGIAVLTIDLSMKLLPRNLSPAHELFHVFQNGYTLFKTPWYYEGTARWSEDLLRAGAGEAGPLPATKAELEDLFKRSYEASRFWQALARATDPPGGVQVPEELRGTRYPGSPKPIIEDAVFHGAPLLKALLEELDRSDDVASKGGSLNPLDWSEARQRSSENDRYIWAAVINVCRRYAPDAPPLRRMVETLGSADGRAARK